MTNAPDTIEMVPLLPMIEEYAKNAVTAIDIGVCKATGSTRYICKGMATNNSQGKCFIGIDHEDLREDFFEQEDWQHYVLGDSREQTTVDKCKELLHGRKADIIMIDTIHEYEFLKQELEMWKQMAHDQTVWLFHDTWMFGPYNPMTDAIKEFAEASSKWKYVDITQEAHGLGALIPIK